ncbi:MAG: hypothetical protein QOF02_1703 [Blastocatellia bacterium]|nr:hypothetical protein [Blastocatellia bacterium]
MASKASIFGHPVHPMIIPFPFALWTFSLVADIVYIWFDKTNWGVAAFYTLAGGLLGAVVAAVPGIIDWMAIKDPQVARIANWHARLNVVALLIFAVDLYLRWKTNGQIDKDGISLPFILSVIGVILISISGWLGGDLSYKHGVGVRPQHDTPEQEAAKVRFS